MNLSDKSKSTLILLFWSTPSCSTLKAYKEKSDLLNLAIKENKLVEVITNSNRILRLRKIGIEAGTFFGLNSIKGEVKKLLLNINQIKKITILNN